MAMREAHCLVCGDNVKASDGKIDAPKRDAQGNKVRDPQTNRVVRERVLMKHLPSDFQPKFIHSDANKRDHPAIPHDGRDPHTDLLRQAHAKEQAEAVVNTTLNQQMLGMSVDDVFRDRR